MLPVKALKVMFSLVVTAIAAATIALFLSDWLKGRRSIKKDYDMIGHDLQDHRDDVFGGIEDIKLV